MTWAPFGKLTGAKASTSMVKSSFPQFLNRTLCSMAVRISWAVAWGFGITCEEKKKKTNKFRTIIK